MSLVDYAKRELAILSPDPDCMQEAMNDDIIEIVEVFSKQGHTGFTANYARHFLHRLLDFKPLTPLTGEDDEWRDINFGDSIQQNKRCSTIFRENYDNTTAYNQCGIIFSDDEGKSWYTSSDSRVLVTFPYIVPEEPQRVFRSPEGSKE